MKLCGRIIFSGETSGEALVSSQGISFYGGVDPETGMIVEKDHDLQGICIAGKILVYPTGKGSTVGSYTLYRLKKKNLAPLAILNSECEPITAIGCILAEIPCIDQIPLDQIHSGMHMIVDANQGIIELSEISSTDRQPIV
jgi:predicted aconitase with swiveling domain